MEFLQKDYSKQRELYYLKGAFNSKASAFDYFLIIEKKTPQEAKELAEIISSCRGVPDFPAKPQSWSEKITGIIKQGNEIAKENPKLTEGFVGLVSGVVAALSGVVVGNKISENNNENTSQRHELSKEEPKDIE